MEMKIGELNPSVNPREVVRAVTAEEWLEGMPPVRQSRVKTISLEPLGRGLTNSTTVFTNWAMNQPKIADRKTGFENRRYTSLTPLITQSPQGGSVAAIFLMPLPFVKKSRKQYSFSVKRIFNHIQFLLKGVKVFALVGRSGTGKSFRAKLVAQKYGIELIIDDGLLIHDQKIIAGKSAKKEKAYLSAIKTALFDEEEHRREVINTLQDTRFKRILLIGTSERMVHKIARRLRLPAITKLINIEDIATTDEIETAIRSRKVEGKHIIPVPSIEIARNYSHIVYDSVKIFLKNKLPLLAGRKQQVFEKTVVRPEFMRKGSVSISKAALTQMVLHCAEEYDSTITLKKVQARVDARGYILTLHIHVPYGVQLSGNLHGFQEYLIDSLERYTGIMIQKVNVIIDDFSA